MTRWPLTEAQSGIWFAQLRDPESPVFNTGQALWMDGPLNRTALEGAVRRLVAEAECLSLRFAGGPDGPVQWLDPSAAPVLSVRDVSGDADPEAAAQSGMWAEAQEAMDLYSGPCAALTLWIVGSDRHVLSQRIHHLAADGYANVLITNRIAALYDAAVTGTDAGSSLTPFSRLLDADRAFAGGPRRDVDREFWHANLDGLGDVGGLGQGMPMSGRWFHRSEKELAPDVMAQVHALAARAGVSWPDVLTLLAAAYCARFVTGDSVSVPGIPLMNRMGPAARTPGTLVNVLPMRLEIDEDEDIGVWLATAAGRLHDLRRHGRYRGEALRRDLQLIGEGKRLHGPLINVLPFDPTPLMAGLRTRLQILGAGSVDDLTFHFRGDGKAGLILQADTNPALHGLRETEGHARRLGAFIAQCCRAGRLADVALLTEQEHQSHVFARNATDHPLPETTLSALLADRFGAMPERTAVSFEGRELDYGDLDSLSGALAAQLAGLGIGPGDRVAIALPRSVELIVALVAVLRAGAAYVPLDPEDMTDRRAGMIERAEPKLILAEAGFGADTPVLAPKNWQTEGMAPVCSATPCDLAYVLFTSGSTGRPKGVEITHDAIVNRILWMQAKYGFTPEDRVLQKTPATFDVSVWEFFLPLITGATLVVAPPGAHRDPRRIAALVREKAITAVHFVPSMLALFLDSPAARGLHIPRVFASGEALPTVLAERFHEVIDGRLHNLYGPTEAAVDVSFHEATGDGEGSSIPIGRPVWNTRLYLLDDRMRPVPDGVAGKLYIAGRQLARGYIGQPDLTRERFVADPFHPGERMYDTGDTAMSGPDGVITYLGRGDGQVKIRGIRIEPGEVEAALIATRLARQAVVSAQKDGVGAYRLIAHVVPEGDASADRILAALAGRLPDTMIPSVVVLIEDLPLTSNGKLDRRALPVPDLAGQESRLPAPGTETVLARLYAEVLGLPAVGPDTDFFAAGGDSLSAVRLLLRIEEETGRELGLGQLFGAPRLSALAKCLDDAHGADHGLGPVIRLSEGSGEPVFAIHPAGGIAWSYREIAREIGDRPLIGLQSPLLDPSAATPENLTALARIYCDRMEELAPSGPMHVMGWSLGGIIAQAAAAELERRGRSVGVVALLDAYPSECWRKQPEPDADAAIRALLAMSGHDPDDHPEIRGKAAILGFLRKRNAPMAALPAPVLDGVVRSVQETNRLVRIHSEPRFGGQILHVYAEAEHAGSVLTPDLWSPHIAGIEVLRLPCRHKDIISREMSARIGRAIREALSTASTKRVLQGHDAG